jgi:hypothetical protein
MRKLLLATTAFAIIGAGSALASGTKTVEFNLSSSLGKECTIAAASTNLTVGPAAAATAQGDFETNCNFEASDLTLTFTSLNGGLNNPVEGNTELYNVSFDGETFGSDAAQLGTVIVRSSGAFANQPIARSFVVALQSDLTIAGDYSDVLSINVAP